MQQLAVVMVQHLTPFSAGLKLPNEHAFVDGFEGAEKEMRKMNSSALEGEPVHEMPIGEQHFLAHELVERMFSRTHPSWFGRSRPSKFSNATQTAC